MTAPKTKFPIESFGPELMQALLEGGRNRLVIPFPGADGAGKRKAHTFQQRIHMLRQRMREERHPQYPLAARVRVSLLWGAKAAEAGAPAEWRADPKGKLGAYIVIQPRDSEFNEVAAVLKGIREPGRVTATEAHMLRAPEPVPQGELEIPSDNPGSRPATLDELFNTLDEEDTNAPSS